MSPATAILCRDCGRAGRAAVKRCPGCGSPRVISHPEADDLAIAHIDCDAFFAAVEKRDDPSLRDRPVIVGGGRRGVVATACYVARTYGVKSAMPMFKALRLCPAAVVIKPQMEKYRRVAQDVRRLMLDLTPLVEPVSIDEAFLDLSGTERLHGGSPAYTLVRLAMRVEAETGITVSIGLSFNKFLAKVASDLEKPKGFAIIGRREAVSFLADRPVSIIPGIGAAAQARLSKAGLLTFRHLRDAPIATLQACLGRDASRLSRLARGEDERPVTPERDRKGLSTETTFDEDLHSFDDLEPILWRLCEKLSTRLKQSGVAARSITLKLKDDEFRISTRSRSGLPPTQLATRLFEPARQLLRVECRGTRYRLLGIGAADLCDAREADLGDLADQEVGRLARREAAIDRLRARFGWDAVQRGLGLRRPQR